MGKQTRFYMADADEGAFVAYLRTTGDVAIIPQTSREELKEEFRQFSEAQGRELGEDCHLWNRSISPKPFVKHYPQQNYYCLDFLQSEVVNVMRSKMTDQGLSMGRLHVEDKVFGGGSMQNKNPRFDAWFTDLCNWLKRNAVRVVDGAYVLPGADALLREGVQVPGHAL